MSEDAALDHLRAILARPEFQTTPSAPLWQQLLAPLGEFLLSLAAQLWQLVSDTASGREGFLGLAALVAAGATLLLGGIYLVRTVQLAVKRDTRIRTASANERRQRSDELWLESERLAGSGRFDDAARAAYLSALYALDERAVLHVQQGLTNREHACRLERDHPRLGAIFRELVEQYDRARYGYPNINAATFAELRRLVGNARDSALSPGAAA